MHSKYNRCCFLQFACAIIALFKTFRREGFMKANCQFKAWAHILNKYVIIKNISDSTSISHLLNQRTLSLVSYSGSTWNHSIQIVRFNWLTRRLINHEHFSRVRVFFTFYFILIFILFYIYSIFLFDFILLRFILSIIILFYLCFILFRSLYFDSKTYILFLHIYKKGQKLL